MVLNLTDVHCDKSSCYFGDSCAMNFLGTLSPPSSTSDSVDVSMASPESFLGQNILNRVHNFSIVEPSAVLDLPFLHIVEEPLERFRFRYRSEMSGTHGSLSGINSDKLRKPTFPTVRLVNYTGPAIVRCSVHQCNNEEPHPHMLVRRVDKGKEELDPHDIHVDDENRHTAVFQGMGIIYTARKDVINELFLKKKFFFKEKLRQKGDFRELTILERAQLRDQAEADSKHVNLNLVRLRFQAYCETNGILQPICSPVYSTIINNLKSALTGGLKIVRMDLTTSRCEGGQEVYMLVEKVVKNNIQIRFFQCDDEDNEIWSDYGKFSHIDVHHQYAIVFRTPPYRDQNIESIVEVCVELVRPSDGARSEPRPFKYKPTEKIGRKRVRRMDSLSSGELPSTLNDLCYTSANTSTFSGIHSDISFESEEFRKLCNEMLPRYAEICLPDLSSSNESLFNQKNTIDGPSTKTTKFDNDWDNYTIMLAPKVASELESLLKLKAGRPDPEQVEVTTKNLFTKLLTTDGNNALHTSILCEQFQILQYFLILLSKMKHLKILNVKNNEGDSALHIALKMSNATVVELLLNVGVDLTTVNNEGNTPLHTAILSEKYELWKDFINSLITDENINKENDEGKTPLHLAILKQNFDCVKKLITKRANVHKIYGSTGDTVLHFAVREKCCAILNYLLHETEARIDQENYSQITPLQLSKILMEEADEKSLEIYNIIKDYVKDQGLVDNSIDFKLPEESDSDDDIKTEPLSPEAMESIEYEIQLSAEDIQELCEALDGTEYLKLLAKELNFEFIGSSLTTKMLLTYIQVKDIPFVQVINALRSFGAIRAIKIIERQMQNTNYRN